jgi:hypothetical protein
MTAVFCHNATDRSAQTWKNQLKPFQHLAFAISDAAKGIASAVQQLAWKRREEDPSAPALVHGLDLFHTSQEAQRVLAQHWHRLDIDALWEQAESCDAEVTRTKKRGVHAWGAAAVARAAWSKVTTALEEFDRLAAPWHRCRKAFDLFRPDGQLNDRQWAESEIKAGLKELTGQQWQKVRNFLTDPRSLAFFDCMHERLEKVEPRAQWRDFLAWRWWRRHYRSTSSAKSPLAELAYEVAAQRPLERAEQAAYDQIATILNHTVRASSAVECMNSVLRMQQSRHRRMTQSMLDLKRLYWNCHRFRSGPRKNQCPYEALGLELPTYDFWKLLQTQPADLTPQLSTSRIAA